MERKEAIDFLDYLRRKEQVTVESVVQVHKTFFNTCTIPIAPIAAETLAVIKKAGSGEAAYAALAARKAKANCMWKLVPELGYAFSEDLVEYLMATGFSAERASEIAGVIEKRKFRQFYKDCRQEDREKFPENFAVWASASPGALESRELLASLFRAEYLEYLHRTSPPESTVLVTKDVPLAGKYNQYRYLSSKLTGKSGDCIVIGFRDGKDRYEERLVAEAELLCKDTDCPEIWIRNFDRDCITVVKKSFYGGTSND